MIKIIIGDSRRMIEVEDYSVDLVITSPPYWYIKDYGFSGQIGYGQSLHEYLKSLYLVWDECYRVLKPGTRLCINTGDQFLRSVVYGRYKVAPLHSEFITQCEQIGFDYMGSIIWQKKTTMNTTGGATIMGSYPYPPNGLIEIDYEFVLILKKPGIRTFEKKYKEDSILSKEEWKSYFTGHWIFGGEKQVNHEAMFPEELPRRLTKMFSFVNDVVLDPFIGSGTTARVAMQMDRNCIGYEINENYLSIISDKLNIDPSLFKRSQETNFTKRDTDINLVDPSQYIPNIKDAQPVIAPNKYKSKEEKLYKVAKILDCTHVELDTGLKIGLIGIEVANSQNERIINYLNTFIKGKEVFIKHDECCESTNDVVPAYLYLKNKIFINKEIIKFKGASVSDYQFKYKKTLLKCYEVSNGQRMDIE